MAVPSEGAKLPWAELAFPDHPLVPVHFVFDPIMRRIALAKQNANDFKAALGGMLDTPLWEEFTAWPTWYLCSDMPIPPG